MTELVEVVFDQNIAGKVIQNVQCFELPDVGGTAFQEFTDALRAIYASTIAARLSDSWVFEGCIFRVYDGGGVFSTRVTPTAGSLAGSLAGEILPRASSLLISTGSNTPRPNRGRLYQRGFTEADWATAGWSATALAAAADFALEITDQLAPEGTNWAIARRNQALNTAIYNLVSDVSLTVYARSIRNSNYP